MIRHLRKLGRALRRRYGRALGQGPQAISRPNGDGTYSVLEVDRRGLTMRTLAKRVPYKLAEAIIKRRHS
jgi:hypothetical protein